MDRFEIDMVGLGLAGWSCVVIIMLFVTFGCHIAFVHPLFNSLWGLSLWLTPNFIFLCILFSEMSSFDKSARLCLLFPVAFLGLCGASVAVVQIFCCSAAGLEPFHTLINSAKLGSSRVAVYKNAFRLTSNDDLEIEQQWFPIPGVKVVKSHGLYNGNNADLMLLDAHHMRCHIHMNEYKSRDIIIEDVWQ